MIPGARAQGLVQDAFSIVAQRLWAGTDKALAGGHGSASADENLMDGDTVYGCQFDAGFAVVLIRSFA